MTITQAINAVTSGLENYLDNKCPLVIIKENKKTLQIPYCRYNILAAKASDHYFGAEETLTPTEESGKPIITRRYEQVTMSVSFTFCSKSRPKDIAQPQNKENWIYGDIEAAALAEKAHSYFLLDGHNIRVKRELDPDYPEDKDQYEEIVVYNIGTVIDRSGFVVEDVIRRYGFDAKFAFIRTDEAVQNTIKDLLKPKYYLIKGNSHT